MTRFGDWEPRLAAFIASVRERPFTWAANDCCTFAAGCVEAMTGEDAMAEFRGNYADEMTGKAALKEIGAGTLVRTMNAKFARVPLSHAHRGDIVMVRGNLGISFGHVSLHVGAEGERQGLIKHLRSEWQRAWSVPMPGPRDG